MAQKPSPKPKHVAHSRPVKRKATANQLKPHTPPAELDRLRLAFQSNVAPYIPAPLPPEATRVGRPTLYRPEFCQIVIDDAALGHTIGATCAILGTTRQTVLEWAVSHPEFGEALARAKTIRQRFGEGHLIDMLRRGGDSTRMSAVKLHLLNVGGDDWKERLTAEHNVTFSLAGLIKESMRLAGPVIDGEVSNADAIKPEDPQD